jgi:hypothetical protein
MQRWIEEVQLLQEEMCRVLAFCEHRAKWWDQLESARTNVFLDVQDGARAYAAKQAIILRNRAKAFATMWASPGALSGAEPGSDDEDE